VDSVVSDSEHLWAKGCGEITPLLPGTGWMPMELGSIVAWRE